MNTPKIFERGLMWFRRDLRTTDNATLHAALSRCKEVHCVFVFDRAILDHLTPNDRRVEFIRESLVELDTALRGLADTAGAGLIVRHAHAQDEIVNLALQLDVHAVFAGRDYEPQAIARDAAVEAMLQRQDIAWISCKDHVIFERRELLTQGNTPYGVFTPYKTKWLASLRPKDVQPLRLPTTFARLLPRPSEFNQPIPSLEAIGFAPTNLRALALPTGMQGATDLLTSFFERMDDYDQTRDFPAVKGPSYLGVHLRFGTVSIRQLVALAWQRQLAGSQGGAVWLSELIWRDFYVAILANFPHVATHAFKPEYDAIAWNSGPNAEAHFAAWCQGQTGYPLVDAAMAQLNQTGYMHNRLRMLTASFLVKDLGIHWRWGERYFAQHLNDFELASNNGGWQWSASTGCDAQPYFRIFNPISQSEKFDPAGKFIRRYLPALAALNSKAIHAPWKAAPLVLAAAGIQLGVTYPHPIVDHATARASTLQRYGVVKNKGTTPVV